MQTRIPPPRRHHKWLVAPDHPDFELAMSHITYNVINPWKVNGNKIYFRSCCFTFTKRQKKAKSDADLQASKSKRLRRPEHSHTVELKDILVYGDRKAIDWQKMSVA